MYKKIQPILFLLLIPFLMGITSQEAEQKYRELGCHRVAGQETTEDCDAVVCDVVQEIVSMSVVEWDEPVEDPDPEPQEPSCAPEWCSLPVQSCDLPPLIGGVDSCGNPCSKPSVEWPNCIREDGSVGPKK